MEYILCYDQIRFIDFATPRSDKKWGFSRSVQFGQYLETPVKSANFKLLLRIF